MKLFASKDRPGGQGPEPHVSPGGHRTANPDDGDWCGALEYAPRAEHGGAQHNPTNILLQTARRAADRGYLTDFINGALSVPLYDDAPDYVVHAQRVLTRLARLRPPLVFSSRTPNNDPTPYVIHG